MRIDGMKEGEYTSHRLTDDITWIDDGKLSSLYVIQGNGAAVVVDTGMGDANVADYIRDNVTKDPLTLVITHGHLDHVMKASDFDSRFYMAPKDDPFLAEFPLIKIENRVPIHEGDVISVPGIDLVCIPAPGHTLGSYLFVDQKRKCVFTGDAYGSGWGMLLNIDGCTTVEEYRDGAVHCLDLLDKLGVDETYTFYGGHYHQKTENERMPLNIPDIQMIRDVKTMCDRVLSGEDEGKNTGRFWPQHTEDTYVASYGKADFCYLKSRVRKN